MDNKLLVKMGRSFLQLRSETVFTCLGLGEEKVLPLPKKKSSDDTCLTKDGGCDLYLR